MFGACDARTWKTLLPDYLSKLVLQLIWLFRKSRFSLNKAIQLSEMRGEGEWKKKAKRRHPLCAAKTISAIRVPKWYLYYLSRRTGSVLIFHGYDERVLMLETLLQYRHCTCKTYHITRQTRGEDFKLFGIDVVCRCTCTCDSHLGREGVLP